MNYSWHASAEETLSGVFAEVFAPREELPPSEWLAKYWHVTGGERSGLIDFDRTPYVRAIVDAYANPAVRKLTVGGCAQAAKTEPIFGLICYSQEVRPGHWMVMYGTSEKAEGVNTQRFLPAIRQSPRIVANLAGGVDGQKTSMVSFKGGSVEFIGSNSATRAEGTPAANVWCDEYDRCDPDGREKLEERGKTFAIAKDIATGTPGNAGEGIDARFQQADARFTWFVPCPHCLAYYGRVWSKDTVVWEGGGNAPIETIRRTASYVCPHCRKKNGTEHRAWQARLGVWVAQTQTVGKVRRGVGVGGEDQAGLISGEIPPGQHWGFWIYGLDNQLEANAVGNIAAKFMERVRSDGIPGPKWETEVLGRPFAPKVRSIEVDQLKARVSASVHSRGTAPPGSCVAVGMIDRQVDRVYYVISAITPGMRDVAVVDYGEVKNVDSEQKVEQFCRKLKARMVPVAGEEPLPISFVGIDTGYEAGQEYAIRHRCGPWLKLLKGRGVEEGKRGTGTADNSHKELFRKKEINVGGGKTFPLVMLNGSAWKSTLAAMLLKPKEARTEEPGEDRELGGGGMDFWLPRDVDHDFLLQLTSEEIRGGLWVLKRPGLANHYWDLAHYTLALLVWWGGREAKPRTKQTRPVPPKGSDDDRRNQRPGSRGLLTD